MTTNINYVLIYKTKFFETFLNDLQTLSEEYQKRLKRVGVLGVNMNEQIEIESIVSIEI